MGGCGNSSMRGWTSPASTSATAPTTSTGKRYLEVRKASDEAGRAVGVLVDLQGPKIRLGRFAAGPVELVDGAAFTITTRDVPGDVDHRLDHVHRAARRTPASAT